MAEYGFGNPEVIEEELDILIIGGGMASCGAAFEVPRWAEGTGLKIKMVYAEHNKWRESQRSVLPGQPRVALLVDPHSNEIGDSGQSIDGIARCGGQRSAYCNNDLDPKMKQAAEAVGEQRVKLYQELWQALYDDAAHVPLFRLKPVYGLAKRLDFTPRMDGLVYVQEMSLAD